MRVVAMTGVGWSALAHVIPTMRTPSLLGFAWTDIQCLPSAATGKQLSPIRVDGCGSVAADPVLELVDHASAHLLGLPATWSGAPASSLPRSSHWSPTDSPSRPPRTDPGRSLGVAVGERSSACCQAFALEQVVLMLGTIDQNIKIGCGDRGILIGDLSQRLP